jgi:hypothetical protein
MSNLTSITKPLVNIPESQKTWEWATNFADWCIAMSPIYKKTKDQQLYDRYNGYRDANRYNHITKTYGIEFPAGKLKHIPLARPLLNALAGEQQERPLGFNVRTDDTDGVELKSDALKDKVLNDLIYAIRDSENDIDEDLNQIEKEASKFQMDFEVSAHHVINNYINTHHTEQDFNDAFIDKMVTGKEYSYCRVNRIGEDPEFKIIKSGSLFFADNNVKWVRETDWAVHPVRMSPVEILDRWGDQLSAENFKKVQKLGETVGDMAYKVGNFNELNDIIEDNTEDPWTPGSNLFDKMIVHFVEFKAIRKVYLIRNKNKYTDDGDAPFIKHVTQDYLDDLKANGHGKPKNLEVRYVQDLYTVVRIGDDIFADVGRVRYPRRDKLRPSRVYLSFDGLTYNGKIKPFSLVEKTEDLQDQYDILHFHKENLIAMSGTKGSYMDISQLPDFGGLTKFEDRLKRWMYYKKMGTAFIDRTRRGTDLTYNQFGNYDDTLGTGLQFILMAIDKLEETTGRVIGVNRQRLGAITQYDGKSNTDKAVQQSNLVTEVIFNEHDEFVRQALEAIVNSCRITYKNGNFTRSYVTSARNQVIFTVTPEFSIHHYSLYFTNRISDERSIQELKTMAYEMIKAQKMEWEDLFPLFRKSNLIDIEQTIIKNIEKRKQEITQQQMQMMQLEQQLTVAKEQAQIAEINGKIEKMKSDMMVNESKLALEQQALQLETQAENQKLMNDARRVDLEAEQIRAATQQKSLQRSSEPVNG